jgi:DNA-binding Lrp family transcriptional regulator
MDDTDRRLIALLRENARVPVATLAHLLKVSRGTVQNRIDRLTADGVIGGFTVRLKRKPSPNASARSPWWQSTANTPPQ